MMSLTFGLFTQVSGSGPLGPLVKVHHLSWILFWQGWSGGAMVLGKIPGPGVLLIWIIQGKDL